MSRWFPQPQAIKQYKGWCIIGLKLLSRWFPSASRNKKKKADGHWTVGLMLLRRWFPPASSNKGIQSLVYSIIG